MKTQKDLKKYIYAGATKVFFVLFQTNYFISIPAGAFVSLHALEMF